MVENAAVRMRGENYNKYFDICMHILSRTTFVCSYIPHIA